jgi:hypothetical protein
MHDRIAAMKLATPARIARWTILAFTLTAASVAAGEGRAEETLRSTGLHWTGSLVSGLFRTPPDNGEKNTSESPSIGTMADAIHPTDILLPSPDASMPLTGAAGGSLASRIVAAEGGPEANSASSAAGYGQFLRGTWLEMFARTYPQLAQRLTSDQILALREVKPLAVELTNRYAQENALSLRRVGLPATEASLSLAHVVGAGGAINILVSHPDQPIENLLSPEAIAANPFMKEKTASTLQQWAMNRVRLPTEPPQPKGATRRFEEELEPLKPTEDFRIDGQTMASQALAENRNTIAALQNLLQAAAKTGAGDGTPLDPSTVAWLNSIGIEPTRLLLADPAAVRLFNMAAARLVLAAIRSCANRVAYRGFKSIESNAGSRGELRPTVIRDVASALAGKMRRESATIMAIVRHRRSAGPGHSTAGDEAAREGATNGSRGFRSANPL